MSNLFPQIAVEQRLIQVSHDDIITAIERVADCEPSDCPVEIAIEREVTCGVIVTSAEAHFLDEGGQTFHRCWLPDLFQRLVDAFDHGDPCNVCSAMVWLPKEHVKEEL